MKFLGNLIWFICGGFLMALILFLLGLICYVTLILIPFGRQFIKIAGLVIAPFGKEVDTDYDAHPYLNIMWMVTDVYTLFTFLVGIILHVTIIGIPFGKQCLKIAHLASSPFGAVVIKY